MIKIADKKIGKGYPVFIIAEAGVNHNGNMEIAKRMIDAAVSACADAVKFQTFRTEDIVTKDLPIVEYQRQNIGKCDSQFNVLKKVELTEKEHKVLKEYCDQKNIIFLSSSHSNKWSVDVLDSLGVVAFKIPSPDVTNVPLLEYVSEKGKPLIISTGMATFEEVKEAIDTVRENTNKIIILHCTTDYPCRLGDVNLRVMETLENEFGLPVGFSDHTSWIEPAAVAVSLGAAIIEKHFTLDKNMDGLDHKASLEPNELKQMIEMARFVEQAQIRDPFEVLREINRKLKTAFPLDSVELILGSRNVKPTESELRIAEAVRKSVVAAKDIKKGVVIQEDMITIKRPGTGLPPKQFKNIIGKKAARNIRADELLTEESFS